MDTQLSCFPQESGKSPFYFILLSPSTKVNQIIYQCKEIADKYLRDNRSSNSIPHISLFQFIMSSKQEQTLIMTLLKYAPFFSSTYIISSNVQKFDSSKTLYVELIEQNGIQNICKLFLQDLLMSGVIKKNKYFYDSTNNLHITITKGLISSQLSELEKLLGTILNNNIPFNCSNIKILKRMYSSERWEEVYCCVL